MSATCPESLTRFSQYISQDGSDADSGKDFQHAKLTPGAALDALEAAGGGALHVEIAEYLGTLRPAPTYLQPGHAGSPDGMPIIAHGGLGIDEKLTIPVGNGPGQVVLGPVIAVSPILPATGKLIGWHPIHAVEPGMAS